MKKIFMPLLILCFMGGLSACYEKKETPKTDTTVEQTTDQVKKSGDTKPKTDDTTEKKTDTDSTGGE